MDNFTGQQKTIISDLAAGITVVPHIGRNFPYPVKSGMSYRTPEFYSIS